MKLAVSQSTEAILSTKTSERPGNQISTTNDGSYLGFEAEPLENTNEPEKKIEIFRRLSAKQLKLKARFQTPKWLFGISRTVELYECRATAGWNFNIQVYNVIPSESPIFEMAGVGDIDGIRQLFSTGNASPFDRDENGLTVLDVRLEQYPP